MYLPFPNIDNRSLSLREQLIERLIQLDRALVGAPDNMIDRQRRYLRGLKDFALLQALEVMVSGITYDNVESMSRLCSDAAYNDGKAKGYEIGYEEGYVDGKQDGIEYAESGQAELDREDDPYIPFSQW